MSKKIIILIATLLAVLTLSGCDTVKMHRYEPISIRYYAYAYDTGLFTTKRKTKEYVEVIWSDGDTIHKDNETIQQIKIGDKTEVEAYEGDDYVNYLYMTLEDYNAMIEENTKGVSKSE